MYVPKKLSALIILVSIVLLSAPAVASEKNTLEVSANIGFLSDYIFRGIHQSDAAANGGIDLTYGPFYLGTWVADLDNDNGIEIDIYTGLDFAIGENHHAGFGYTAYRYSDDDSDHGFDDDYDEFNFYAGSTYGELSVELEYTIGEHDILDDSLTYDENDYDFLAVTFDYRGAYVTFGEFGISKDDEDKGEPNEGYIEIGYGTIVSGIDLSAALIHTDEELDANGDDDETRVVFSASYSFNLYGGETE